MNKLILSAAIVSFFSLTACNKQEDTSKDLNTSNKEVANVSTEPSTEPSNKSQISDSSVSIISDNITLEQSSVELIDKNQKCISKDEITSSLDPGVLASSSYTCVMNGEYENALYSYTLSLFYAQYDVNRLKDKIKYTSAFSNYLMELEKTDKAKSQPFVDYFNSKSSNPEFSKVICNFYREVGPPTYEMDYLNLKVENKKFTDEDFIIYDQTMLMEDLLKSCS